MSPKQAGELQRIVHHFLFGNVRAAGKYTEAEKAVPEAFLCVFSVDSSGAIIKVHLRGEYEYIDTAYAILSKMKSIDFKDWKAPSCIGKTLVIPITVIPPYMDFRELDEKSGVGNFLPGETGNVIITRSIAIFLTLPVN